MELHRLPPEREAVKRYTEQLWLPYHRDLEATVDAHTLADDLDLEAELEFRLDKLESEQYRLWIAVDGAAGTSERSLADVDGQFAGFIATNVDEAPSVFDRPDRLVVGDLFVHEQYRGTGLARQLLDRAVERARAADCETLVLEVDVDNERARRFYEQYGFETYRLILTAPVGR